MKKKMTLHELYAMRPSDLLRLAVRDARAVSKRPNTQLNMHAIAQNRESYGADVCHVCMAGAVMLKSLGMEPDSKNGLRKACADAYAPGTGEETPFTRINDLRQGNMCSVVTYGDARNATVKAAGAMIRDKVSSVTLRAPWAVYLRAADLLESVGQ